jgi:hypothetical protein
MDIARFREDNPASSRLRHAVSWNAVIKHQNQRLARQVYAVTQKPQEIIGINEPKLACRSVTICPQNILGWTRRNDGVYNVADGFQLGNEDDYCLNDCSHNSAAFSSPLLEKWQWSYLYAKLNVSVFGPGYIPGPSPNESG